MSEIRYSLHRTLNEVMWCMYSTLYMCSCAPVLQTRVQRSPCQISFYFMSEFQWVYWEVSMMRGYFRVVADTHHPSQLWELSSELVPNGEKIPCSIRQAERGLKQSGVLLLCKDPGGLGGNRVATLDVLPSHFAADWMAGLRPTAAAAETVQIFCNKGCKHRLQSWERKRGRKSLSGEMVGSRDVNARESRGEKACQHLDVGMEREKWPLQAESRDGSFSCREGNRAETRRMRIIELNYLVLEQMRLSTRNKDGI